MRRSRYTVGRAGAAATVLLAAGLASALAAAPAVAGDRAAVAGQGAGPGTWLITTIAGGPGGPGPARRFAARDCALAYAGGVIYATSYSGLTYSSVIRGVRMSTGSMRPVAGSGVADNYPDVSPDGTPAGDISIGDSCGVAVDRNGNLLFADTGQTSTGDFNGTDGTTVRVMAATSGTFYRRAMVRGRVYTIAGNGIAGFSGDGGPATSAELNVPGGLAVDPAGNVIVVDRGNDRLRIVAARTGTFYGQAMTAGHIYTVAGDGAIGHSGDGGPATSAELGLAPAGCCGVLALLLRPQLTVDRAGNIVLADGTNGRIRVIAGRTGTFYGQPMTEGDIYTIAGGGSTRLGDSGPARKVALGPLSGITLDRSGNVVFATPKAERVRLLAVTSGGFYGRRMRAGYVYTIAGRGLTGFGGDGGPALRAEFSAPAGVAIDRAGNVVIADGPKIVVTSNPDNQRLRVVAERTGRFYGVPMKAGDIYTIAGPRTTYRGDGAAATGALLRTGGLSQLGWVGVSARGAVAIADTRHGHPRIRLVSAVSGSRYGRPMKAGDIYTIAGDGRSGTSGNGGPGRRAELSRPRGVVFDRAGNVLLSGPANIRVVVAGSGTFYGRPMRAGYIYSIAGTGKVGYSGDGGPATAAKLHNPAGIAFDRHGNVVFSDAGSARVRVIAARPGIFYGLRMKAGHIYTIARALAQTVAVDPAGNIVLCSGSGGSVVRVLAARSGTFYGQPMRAGHMYLVAGHGNNQSSDGIPATAAFLGRAAAAADRAGNLIIAELGSLPNSALVISRLRVVAGTTGTFYGQAMIAGDIYTIAGNGTQGTGDQGPATQASFGRFGPSAVAVTGSGPLVVGDGARIREIFES
jgi:hypothetical protein